MYDLFFLGSIILLIVSSPDHTLYSFTLLTILLDQKIETLLLSNIMKFSAVTLAAAARGQGVYFEHYL